MGQASVPRPVARRPLVVRDVQVGLGVWLISTIIIVGAGLFGWQMLTPCGEHAPTAIDAFAKWDGGWYASIFDRGYGYDASDGSNVVFFPAFPCCGGALAWLTGISQRLSLFLVAQFCAAAMLVVFHAYLRLRFPADGSVAAMGVLVFAFFPPTFFFHMTYSESLFALLVAATLLAVEARLPLWSLALIIGLATAARPVGAGLILVMGWQIHRRSATWAGFCGRCLVLLPLSQWGLLAYAGYLWERFGDPLVFAKAQSAWSMYPDVPWADKIVALVELKPIWASVIPRSGHCMDQFGIENFYVTGSGINAFFYVLGWLLLAVGMWKRWLTGTEFLAAIGLLTIPYLTRGYDSAFQSFARFTSVALPIYIPLTLLILRLPPVVRICYLLICAWLITIFAALFTSGYHLV